MNIVNGQAKNVYSKGDYILRIFQLISKNQEAAGRHPIHFNESNDNED